MQTIPIALKQPDDAHEIPRTKQCDRLELLAAAFVAEGICPSWFADRLIDNDQVQR